MEACLNGDLRTMLTNHGGKFPEWESIKILFQILKGLKCLVENKVAHRDIKPENIFIHNELFKLADFGFC